MADCGYLELLRLPVKHREEFTVPVPTGECTVSHARFFAPRRVVGACILMRRRRRGSDASLPL